MQQVGGRLDGASVTAHELFDTLRVSLESLAGLGCLVVECVVSHLLRGVRHLVSHSRSSTRLVERTDVVVHVDLAVAGEGLGAHRIGLSRYGGSAVHQSVADVDTEDVAHRRPHIAWHRFTRHAFGPAVGCVALGAHRFRQRTVVGGPEAHAARVREPGPSSVRATTVCRWLGRLRRSGVDGLVERRRAELSADLTGWRSDREQVIDRCLPVADRRLAAERRCVAVLDRGQR